MSDQIETQEAVATQQHGELARPADLLSVIAQAVADPRMDVEKMSKLLDMHERIMNEQRKVAFTAAMSRLQAKLPQIKKDARIIVKGVERSRYTKYETIDRAIQPLLAEEGFALSFDTDSKDGRLFNISCKLSHREGHSETKFLLLPLDASDFRSNVQSIGSTVSYAKRQLVKMHLNLVEADEDDDGNGGSEPITKEQVWDLQALIDEAKADKAKFLNFMGVGDLAEILQRDYKKAVNALEAKRRAR